MMAAELKPYPAYKDSGVPWLGEVPAHWVELPLKRIARIDNSGNYGGEPESGECVLPVATTAQIDKDGHFAVDDMPRRGFSHKDAGRYRCQTGDILVVKSSGSIFNVISGKAGIVESETPEFVFSNFLLRVVARRRVVNPRYLFLLLSGHLTRERVKRMVTGSTYPNLQVGEYISALLPLPPFPEQTAIVRFLDHADRRIQRYIHAKQKLIALLEEQKQAIIHQAVTGQIDVRTGQPYPAYKPSGVEWLGGVPGRWERRRLKTLLRSVDRRSTTGKETLLSLRRDHGVVVYAEHFARPPQGRTLVGFKLVAEGQLVVNRMQANNGLVFCSGINGLVSPDYSVFEMREPLQMQYLSDLLRISGYRAHFRREATGLGTGTAGFLRLYDEKLLETVVFLPPLEEQILILKSLAEGMARIKRLIEREQRELQLIGEYRTRLIADVVTGKLDVREAAARLPAVDPLAAEDTPDDTVHTDAV